MSEQAQPAAQSPATPEQTPAAEPTLQESLAASTIAMLGGAPKSEVARLGAEEKALIASLTEKPAAPEVEPKEEPAEVAEVETPEVGKPAEPEPEQPAGVIPPADPEPPTPQPKDDNDQTRYRFSTPEDRAIASLAKAKGISIIEAARIYSGDAPAKVAAEPEPEPTIPQVYVSPSTAELQAKATEIEQKLTEIEDSSADGVLLTSDVLKLQREYAKITGELSASKRDDARAGMEVQSVQAKQSANWAETVKQYPDLGNKKSALFLVADKLASDAHNPDDPDHLAGQQPDAPRFFAEKAANLLNIKPVTAKAAPAVAPSTIEKPAPKPGPASGTRQTQPPPAEKSDADRKQAAIAKTFSMIGGGRGLVSAPTSDEVLVI